MLEELQTELKPVGALEQSLLERIAVTLWRQRRLVTSETAQINLNNKESNIVSRVNGELNLGYSENKIINEDLTEFDQAQLKIYQSVVDEYHQLNEDKLNDLTRIKKYAPLIYQQLAEGAKMEELSIKVYLELYDSPAEYVDELIRSFQSLIRRAEQRPLVLEIARTVQNEGGILKGQIRDSLAKYQVMLDNELYKAIKALRETQAWRLETLEPVTEQNGFVLENDD